MTATVLPQQQQLPSDVVGVIAEFISPTTRQQKALMRVNHTWYQGVVQQNGMKAKERIYWPLDALLQREPRHLTLKLETGDDEDLEAVQPIAPKVEGLILACCEELSASGLTKIDAFTNLRKLDLSILDTVTDDLLRHVLCEPPTKETAPSWGHQLGELDLSNVKELSDASLEMISKTLPKLHRFSCANSRKITNSGVGHLVNLPALSHLAIGELPEVTDISCVHIARMVHLTSLDMSMSTQLSDVGVEKLSSLPVLATLNISSCKNLTENAVKAIGSDGFPALTALHLDWCHQMKGDATLHLAKMKTKPAPLRTLHCFSGITDSGLNFLGRLTTLVELRMPSTSFHLTNSGIGQLGRLMNLSVLECSMEKMDDGTLQRLSICVHLTELKIRSSRATVTGDGFVQLCSKLTKLSSLALFIDALDDACLLAVASSVPQDLAELTMNHSGHITDVAIDHITKKLRGLVKLDLCWSLKMTDASMFYIGQRLKSLKTLLLFGCRELSDAGLVPLRELWQLEFLNIGGCPRTTHEGAAKIAEMVQDVGWETDFS